MTEKVSAVKLEHSLVLGLCYRKANLTVQAEEFIAVAKGYFLGANRESAGSPNR